MSSPLTLRILLTASLLFAAAAPAQAANKGLAKEFDWRASWGDILPDTKIMSSRHNIKNDISGAVKACGISDNYYNAIKGYTLDFDSDGSMDYIIDELAYFLPGQSQTCDVQVCQSGFCYVAFYRSNSATQYMEETPETYKTRKFLKTVKPTQTAAPSESEGTSETSETTPVPAAATETSAPAATEETTETETAETIVEPCPKTAFENTACRPDCPALPFICPSNFVYKYDIGLILRVSDWAFISVNEYNTFRNSPADKTPDGLGIKHRAALNKNPILKVKTEFSNCTLEEIDANNNGAIESTEACVKYMQHDGKVFVDMYAPQPYQGGVENDTRYALEDPTTLTRTPTVAANGLKDTLVVDPATKQQRSSRELFKRSTAVIQMTPETEAKAAESTVKDWRAEGLQFTEKGRVSVQVAAFHGPASAGGVLNPNEPAQGLICDTFTNNSALKYFIPTKTDAEYQSFRSAAAKGSIAGLSVQACVPQFTAWVGLRDCPPMPCETKRTISAERLCQRPTSAFADCSECAGIKDPDVIATGFKNKCFFSKVCQGAVCPKKHHSCLSAAAKILMADGSLKPIGEIAIGDEVMAFDKNGMMAPLRKAKVEKRTVTEKQSLVAIDGMQITPNHLLPTRNGKLIAARDIKSGDVLLDGQGSAVTVKNTTAGQLEATVYNLVLDDADGFVADGVRVLSYPELGAP